jgi:hypothetical protein
MELSGTNCTSSFEFNCENIETVQASIWWQVKMVKNWPNENYTKPKANLHYFQRGIRDFADLIT